MMDVKVIVENEEDDSSEAPDEWEIKSWCNTICDAEKIKADPEKMAYVKPMMEEMGKTMQTSIKSIKDIKVAANKMAMQEDDSEEE